jgi:hypothetical protein
MSLSVVERLGASANDSAWLVQRGRHLEATLLLGVGADSYLLRIHRGRVEAVEHGPFVMPRWTFALKASSEAWATFWQPVPPPGCHDLIAMIKTRRLSVEGDLHPFFANLRYFKELLALPRAFLAGAQRGTQ